MKSVANALRITTKKKNDDARSQSEAKGGKTVAQDNGESNPSSAQDDRESNPSSAQHNEESDITSAELAVLKALELEATDTKSVSGQSEANGGTTVEEKIEHFITKETGNDITRETKLSSAVSSASNTNPDPILHCKKLIEIINDDPERVNDKDIQSSIAFVTEFLQQATGTNPSNSKQLSDEKISQYHSNLTELNEHVRNATITILSKFAISIANNPDMIPNNEVMMAQLVNFIAEKPKILSNESAMTALINIQKYLESLIDTKNDTTFSTDGRLRNILVLQKLCNKSLKDYNTPQKQTSKQLATNSTKKGIGRI